MEYYIDDIKRIEDKLDDTESKDYYYGIIQYNITGRYEYLHDVLKKYKSDFTLTRLIEDNKNGQVDEIVIFGAGGYGKQVFDLLGQFNIRVKCFIDNDKEKQGKEICGGVKVLNPQKFNDSTKYIISILTGKPAMIKQLIGLGVDKSNIVIYFETMGNQYFDQTDIIATIKDECVFVDGGSYNGNNSIEFVKNIKPNCKRAIMFEPEDYNIKVINENVLKSGLKNLELAAFGLWDKRDTLKFKGHNASGKVSKDGSVSVEVTSVDEYFSGEEVNFIKMDIEGAELNALMGCENTIKKYKPVLAICTYHKPEDIIILLKYILELNPEYHLRLRMYSSIKYESVVYAY